MRRFALVSWALLSSCAADPCNVSSPCLKDPQPSAAEVQACDDAIANGVKCATQQRTYNDCFNANRVCGSDQTTDLAATSAKCETQAQALSQCLM